MNDTVQWEAEGEERRNEVIGFMEQNIGTAQWHLREADELLNMMCYMTSEPKMRPPFEDAKMITRIAEMLNYFLDYLVNPEKSRYI
jgi:hypothetical protein